MKIIEVTSYDFHIYTASIWINESISAKVKVDLGNYDNDRTPERLYKKLKEEGFKKVKPTEISYGGDIYG